MSVMTTAEVAAELRCSPRKVTETASRHSIGANLGGKAGYRFTEADVRALWDALRPVAVVAKRKRRSRARSG